MSIKSLSRFFLLFILCIINYQQDGMCAMVAVQPPPLISRVEDPIRPIVNPPSKLESATAQPTPTEQSEEKIQVPSQTPSVSPTPGKTEVPNFEFPTLVEWTAKCLSSYDERFDHATFQARPILSGTELNQTLNCFLKKFNDKGIFSQWVGLDSAQTTESLDYKYPYVTKIDTEPDSVVCFMGDLHGSLHSLLRNLWRLVALGYLDKSFKITKKNFYMIFTGDYVDRGRYGAEVLYTLMRLKCAKWGNVYLIRGNHEVKSMNERQQIDGGGFQQELTEKYQHHAPRLFAKICDIYQRMPLAVYLTCNNQSIMATHGGLGPYNYYYDKQMQSLMTNKNKRYRHLPLTETDLIAPGFQWCDISQVVGPEEENRFINDPNRVWRLSVGSLKNLLERKNLKALFRGHQHGSFGLKMLFNPQNIAHVTNPKEGLDTDSSLYHWTKVLRQNNPQDLEENNNGGFEISKYAPIFTFSSAPEGVLEPFDCFGLLFMNGLFDTWRLKVFEYDSPLKRFQKTIEETQGDLPIFTTIRKTTPQSPRSSSGMPDPIRAGFIPHSPIRTEAQQIQDLTEIVDAR